MEVGQGPNWGCSANGKKSNMNTAKSAFVFRFDSDKYLITGARHLKFGVEIDINLPPKSICNTVFQ
jgi:hypothetical protein